MLLMLNMKYFSRVRQDFSIMGIFREQGESPFPVNASS